MYREAAETKETKEKKSWWPSRKRFLNFVGGFVSLTGVLSVICLFSGLIIHQIAVPNSNIPHKDPIATTILFNVAGMLAIPSGLCVLAFFFMFTRHCFLAMIGKKDF